jgi:hypothetical protein
MVIQSPYGISAKVFSAREDSVRVLGSYITLAKFFLRRLVSISAPVAARFRLHHNSLVR